MLTSIGESVQHLKAGHEERRYESIVYYIVEVIPFKKKRKTISKAD